MRLVVGDRLEQPDDADALQQDLNDVRDAMQMPTMIPALKAVVAQFRNEPEWERLRPPLLPLSADRQAMLFEKLEQLGFALPD